MLALFTVASLFGYGYSRLRDGRDIDDILALGLGNVSPNTIIVTSIMGDGTSSLLANVVLVNIPQLVLSLLYFGYNRIFTSLSLASEWGGFSLGHKGLRLSSAPASTLAAGNVATRSRKPSAQHPTYFLQLPLRHALPLLVFSATLHWLISQSLFLVYVERYASMPFDAWEPPDHPVDERPRTFSPYWPWPRPGVMEFSIFGDPMHPPFRKASSPPWPLAIPASNRGYDAIKATSLANNSSNSGFVSPWYPATLHARYVSPIADGKLPADLATCGWSPCAVLCVLVLGATTLGFAVWVGWGTHVRGHAGMPMAGSCSMAIAAACHLPPPRGASDGTAAAKATAAKTTTSAQQRAARQGGPGYRWEWDDEGADDGGRRPWERPLMWGVVLEPYGDVPGHCAFSPGPVGVPVEGLMYA